MWKIEIRSITTTYYLGQCDAIIVRWPRGRFPASFEQRQAAADSETKPTTEANHRSINSNNLLIFKLL